MTDYRDLRRFARARTALARVVDRIADGKVTEEDPDGGVGPLFWVLIAGVLLVFAAQLLRLVVTSL